METSSSTTFYGTDFKIKMIFIIAVCSLIWLIVLFLMTFPDITIKILLSSSLTFDEDVFNVNFNFFKRSHVIMLVLVVLDYIIGFVSYPKMESGKQDRLTLIILMLALLAEFVLQETQDNCTYASLSFIFIVACIFTIKFLTIYVPIQNKSTK